jgi:DNA-binding YbaB/EbfC family protein
MKGGMGNLLKQAQKISENIAKVQAELEAKEVESSVGGGMVKVVANGQQEVLRIHVEKDVVDPNDVEMLEDLLVAGVNEALKQSRELAEEEIKKVAGPLAGGLPGGLGIPGL